MIGKSYGYNLKINKKKSYARINRYIYKEYEQAKKKEKKRRKLLPSDDETHTELDEVCWRREY